MDKNLIDYFIDETNRKFDKLDKKVDQIIKFKWQIIGGSLVASFVITAFFQIALVLINKN